MASNPLVPPQKNPLIPPKLQLDPMPNPLIRPGAPSSPSPSLGFQTWASSPLNSFKVQSAMIAPGAPLQPNAGNMAAVNPPQTMASSAPPRMPSVTGGDSAILPPHQRTSAQPSTAPVSYAANPSGSTPMASSMPPGGLPQLPATMTPPVQSQLQADTAKLQQLQTQGAGLNKIQNPWLRILAKVGDTAGTVLAPGLAAAIPGTTVHNWQLQGQQKGIVAQDQQNSQAAQQTANNQASLAKTQLETQQMPEELDIKKQAASLKGLQAQGQFAQHGLKVADNGDGTTSVAADENSPVYKQQQDQQALIQAHTEAFNAQSELRSAQTEVEKAKNNPNSPAFQLATRRLAVAQQNAAAATTRASAYQGRYLQSAYNVGLNGQALPGAPVISDDQGNQTIVGSANAGLATKNQSNAARFNDVHGALDSLEGAARALAAKGGSLSNPRIAAALAQPKGTLGQWLQGQGAKAGLTPEERAYVQANAAAHENIQALRGATGTGATDSQINRLESMIPGASTPDLNYFLGQTGQIRATADRLGKGATVATGGLSVRGQKNQNAMKPPSASGNVSPEGTVIKMADGTTQVKRNGKWVAQ